MAEHKMQIVNGIRCRPEDADAVRERLVAAGHAIVEPTAKRTRRKPAAQRLPGDTGGDVGDQGDDDSGEGTGDGSAES